MKIKEVSAKKIKDSRGEWTIEVCVNRCRASSPSGRSTGKYETPSYLKSIDNNIKLINRFEELEGMKIERFDDLFLVERVIKSKFHLKDAKQFGANALFALESAILKALAKEKKLELWQIINPGAYKMPIPVGNAVGGGLHSHNPHHPIFQEFLIIPKEHSFQGNVTAMYEIYKAIGMILNAKEKNDEGAWETSFFDEQILEIMKKFERKMHIGVDFAASTLFKEGYYRYKNLKFPKKRQIKYINYLINHYHIFYSEDPLQEEDFSGFKEISHHHLVVGDDLTATHLDRLKKALKEKSINAMIIKPNQNGSLLELKEIFDFCKHNNIHTIISHRSGETFDDSLADYAFAFEADYIKCGISTLYRELKLQRLIEIERSVEKTILHKKVGILN